MKYALFNSRKSTVAKLIRWFSWCGTNGYSHAAFVFPDGTVYESKEFIGVRKIAGIHMTMEPGETYQLFEVKTTPYQDRLLREWLDSIITAKWGYDYWGVLGFVFHWVNRGVRVIFCSALVVLGLRKVGVDMFPDLPHYKCCPDLLSHCAIAWPRERGEM